MKQTDTRRSMLLPDPRYSDQMVTRFINTMMMNGKKETCYNIFYGAMDEIKRKTKEEGVTVWKKAMENAMPQVEVRSRRVGGATLQIPTEIRTQRKISLTMKWLILYARQRKGKSMRMKLAEELIAASKMEGGAYKKKEDTHKMAEANKAFAHFRF
ncbi:MAG: 30S ribosomal protein S7 [Bacteroidetes bacterium]|nr:30S ribosomal protein S7 [Bacteroidota bacterium]